MLTQKNATARGSGNNFSSQQARSKKITLRQPLPRAVAFSLVCQVTLDNRCCGFLFAATTRGCVFTASSMSLHLHFQEETQVLPLTSHMDMRNTHIYTTTVDPPPPSKLHAKPYTNKEKHTPNSSTTLSHSIYNSLPPVGREGREPRVIYPYFEEWLSFLPSRANQQH